MKKVILALLLIVFSFPVAAKDKESVYDRVMKTGTIRCGYFTWPPYLKKDPNSEELSGPTFDYMEAIGKELDVKIIWAEEIGVGEAITGLDTNRYDVMCMSLWPDPARLKNTLLTDPIFYSAVYAVTRKGDNRFNGSLTKINNPNVTVVGIDGDITHSVGVDTFSKAKMLALPQMSDASHLLHSIVSKKADVTFVDEGLVKDFIKANGDVVQLIKNVPAVKVFPEVLAVRRDEVRLKMMLDSAINILTTNNYAEDILKNHVTSSFGPSVPYNVEEASK